MKRLVKNIMMLAVVAIAAVACHKDDFVTDIPQVESDMMHLRFGVVSPDMRQVSTRAVDPDGKGIQNITLFCFDDEGLFISTATARIEGNSDNDEVSLSGGIFDALVPQATRVMHLLANQNMSTFSEDTFRAKSENEVMSILEGSSGMMIYWARVAVPQTIVSAGEQEGSVSDAIKAWLEAVTNEYPIIMLRNQAKVTVEVDDAKSDFVVDGFAVDNSQAFGTVAPYHMTYGFPSYAHGEVTTDAASYEASVPSFYIDKAGEVGSSATNQQKHWHDTHFITLPENDSKLTNISEIFDDDEFYIFESENSSGDPVNVIIKGKRANETVSKYYRVTLTDENGEQVLVERNHHYKIIIEGTLDFGQNTFAEALTAPPTNNIWLSISDEVNEVQDQEFLLRVDQTSAVVGYDGTNFYKPSTETDPWTLSGSKLTLYFEVEDVDTSDSNVIKDEDLSVTWLGDYNVSATDVSSATEFETTSGEGAITIDLNSLGDAQMKEGTILVKYGRLQRKIKVVTIRRQKFEPIWVSTQVYGSYDGADNSDRANVTLMFHVPESCPDELLPFEVMLSVNVLDVRSESGQTLPVIRADDPRYGADNGIGYKYVYTVTQKGTQRIYLESILNQEDGASEKLKIESPYFETEEKTFTFTFSTRSITLTNATATNPTATDEAEKLWYVLVPQKAGAPVVLNLQLKENGNNTEAGKYDEFFLYSQYLDHYTDDVFSSVRTAINETTTDAWMNSNYTSGTENYFPCQFAPVDEALWGSGGRVYAFIQRPRFSSIDFSNTNDELPSNVNKGHFSVYMQTNRAKCAEVVRISSNQPESKAAFTTTSSDNIIYNVNADNNYLYSYISEPTSGKTYKGKSDAVLSYRSFVFELANYRPYRFEASVTGVKDKELNNIDHDTESTEPEEIDDVLWSYEPNQEIDIQFDITDFKAADGTEVHPFGQEFEIYIKAPMLEKSANSSLSNDKFYYDNTKECFVYKVASTRDGEKSGTLQTKHDDGVRREEGERKSLKFTTKDIVSEGQITISSNQDQVVYQSKTFNVQNTPIRGSITYTEANSTDKKQLPNKAFVSFTRVNNSSRIGAIVVSNDGSSSTFELRLRKEYEFSWQNDEVQLYYSVPQDNIEGDGKTYKVTNYYTANYSSLSALYAAMAGGTGTVNLTYAGQNKLEINN